MAYMRLGDVLIEKGFITEKQRIEALQMQLGVDSIDLTTVSIPLEMAKFVPRAIARRYCVVPARSWWSTLPSGISSGRTRPPRSAALSP
ncbi:MAG: hypothetical protein PUB59_06555 [Firmicutes bacterium]|nr:hypothetical protein [Bacillota bacterium]